MRELDNILTSYLSYRSELEKVNEKKQEFEIMPNALKEISIISAKSIQEDILKQLSTELKSIDTPIEAKMVSFESDSNRMLAKLNSLGKLVEKVRSRIDYKSKKQPLVIVCGKGKGTGQLNLPRDVTVDNETGNIYIADTENYCVKVFDSAGKYLFKFADNKGEGKMDSPLSVAIYGYRILISQYNNVY